ncbi:MAG: site-2 protease family protein [Clostridia bacterium]|nr:site-2 protease family protein [Clostridia bacterium]
MLDYLITGGGDWRTYLIHMLLSLPIILFALSLHETAHGYVAYKLGDPTARSLGRLTLNPLKHLDPIGFICMVLFGFGWAHPVPINSRYFKKPRRDMALASLAGPVSNILAAVVFSVLYGIALLALNVYAKKIGFTNETVFMLCEHFLIFLYYGVSLNVTLAVFNILPIPPLDGSRIVSAFLPPTWAYKYMKYERIISIVLMALLFFGVLSPIISKLTDIIIGWLMWIPSLFLMLLQFIV